MAAPTAVAAPAPDPDEEEAASGLLRFTVSGAQREIPELKWRANRGWTRLARTSFGELVDVPAGLPEGLEAMADAHRELVLAYDTTGGLGDLEDATDRQIEAIYEKLVTVAFPLASSVSAAVMAMAQEVIRARLKIAADAGSAPPSSTSSDSPSGTSGPTSLRRPSRSGRSSSSTRRPRSA